MKCLACGERTEVLETIQRPAGTRRRRRCLVCATRFTTTEIANENIADLAHRELERQMNELALMNKPSRTYDPEAVAAAIAVDRRKAIIAARQKLEEDQEDDERPSRLSWRELKRELGR